MGLQPGEATTLTAVYGSVWYVAQNGGNDANGGAYPDEAKQTIKAALTNAVEGDVVKVYPGVYGEADGTMMQTKKIDSKTAEFYVASRVVVPGGVALESVEGAEKTFIVGRADPSAEAGAPDYGMGPGAVRCVLLNKDASISGFTITGGRADKYDGTRYDDNSESGGILGATCESCTVSDCIVSNNVADEGGFGMNCTFVRSRIVDNIGVTRHASRNCRFCGCYINRNRGGAMEHVRLLDSCTIGPTSRNTADTKDVAFLQYPSVGGKFVNSILLAKISALASADYCYSVTNCVLLASEEDELQNAPYYAPAYDHCAFVAQASDVGLDADFRPVPGVTTNAVLDAVTPTFDAMSLAGTVGANDVIGVPRVMNGVRDLGAFEGDWRPRYSSDIGGRAQVVEASPDVVEANGKVTIPDGSKIVFTLNNKSAAAKEYALNVTVTDGTLSVLLDGETVTVTDATDIRLAVPAGVHSVTVALDGETTDVATIQSLRSQSGVLLIMR